MFQKKDIFSSICAMIFLKLFHFLDHVMDIKVVMACIDLEKISRNVIPVALLVVITFLIMLAIIKPNRKHDAHISTKDTRKRRGKHPKPRKPQSFKLKIKQDQDSFHQNNRVYKIKEQNPKICFPMENMGSLFDHVSKGLSHWPFYLKSATCRMWVYFFSSEKNNQGIGKKSK